MLVAPIPCDTERNLFELLLFRRVDVARTPYLLAAEMHHELRYQIERTYFIPCAAWPIHCQIEPVSMPSSMPFQD